MIFRWLKQEWKNYRDRKYQGRLAHEAWVELQKRKEQERYAEALQKHIENFSKIKTEDPRCKNCGHPSTGSSRTPNRQTTSRREDSSIYYTSSGLSDSGSCSSSSSSSSSSGGCD